MPPATHLDATPPLTASTTPASSSASTEPATPASPICTRAHALYCFDVLVAHFEGREPMSPPFENPDEPLYVSVSKERRVEGWDQGGDRVGPGRQRAVARENQEATERGEGVASANGPDRRGHGASIQGGRDDERRPCEGGTGSLEPWPTERQLIRSSLFVTWNTVSHLRPNKKPALRGCIGNFSPMPLAKGLQEYALISALEDHRFNPITKSELPSLQCSISLLTPFTPIPDPLDWTIGQHGIHITFSPPSTSSTASSHTAGRSRALSATYLPEVCADQGWTKEEAVLSAIQKAGYRGRVKVGDAVWEGLRVKRYGSVKASAAYGEYEVWRGGKGTED